MIRWRRYLLTGVSRSGDSIKLPEARPRARFRYKEIAMFKKFLLFVILFSLFLQSRGDSGENETVNLLFQNAEGIMSAANASQLNGDADAARGKYTTASYLLEKIRQDFPDWNSETVDNRLIICRTELGEDPALPVRVGKVTMLFKSIVADSDYEPKGGDIYEISLEGDDRSNLKLIYKKLKPFAGDARVCLQTLDTPSNRFLLDSNNPKLFRDEEGEIILEIVVPSEWPLFLAEFAEGPYGNPQPLSNIIKIPEDEEATD